MPRLTALLPRPHNQALIFFLPKPDVNARLIKQLTPILTRIIQHPFNQHMYIGTLPYPYFKKFLQFDVNHYLPQYIEAIHRLRVRFQTINQPQYSAQFMQLEHQVRGYIERIRTMYPDLTLYPQKHSFFKLIDYQNDISCHNFLNHLLKEDTPARMAARIIACLWLYLQLGKHLNPSHCPIEHYRSWIEMYHRPGFINSTYLLLETLNALIQASTPFEQQQITQAFQESLDNEFKIIDSIYPQEPVAKFRHILYCK